MNVFKLFAKNKVYFNRSGNYLAILNFLLLIANFKINYSINIPVLVAVLVGFFVALSIGFFDYHFIMKHELRRINKNNDVKDQVERIERKLDKIMN